MPRARFTQAEIARIIRAARDVNPQSRVQIAPDGTVTILPPLDESATQPPNDAGEVVPCDELFG